MQEPWLLHDFAEDFYGEDLRLVIVGYIRPEVLSYMIALATFWPLAHSSLALLPFFHAKFGCGM